LRPEFRGHEDSAAHGGVGSAALVRLWITETLEEGRFGGPLARACARAWAPISARALARRMDVPAGVRVVAVGGATLGGSGKTPLAIASAREIASAGARVVLVGHAYRARPGRARFVGDDDALADVGDEALAAAWSLSGSNAKVAVAPERAAAVAWAARHADVLVLDGVAQLAPPARATMALIAVDARQPWGRARSVAPAGDLRAPVSALVGACDGVVAMGDFGVEAPGCGDDIAGHATTRGIAHLRRPVWCARVVSAGARIGPDLIPWEELAQKRVGLLCALARPERLIGMLAARSVAPACVLRAPDHGPCSNLLFERARRAGDDLGIDVWLATPKCAPHFHVARTDGAPRRGKAPPRPLERARASVGGRVALRAPLGVIEYALALPDDLRERLRRLAAA
jgi:tetraacyldisaccharide 4'-kinase